MELKFQSFTKEVRFADLVSSINHCNLCSRMDQRTKVLSEQNGNIFSKVVFIAEAPGRLGADRTGIPLYGDKTGDNFEMLLGTVGWHRKDIFITNAILCNPRNEDGNNCTPTQQEIRNCSYYLDMTIKLVQPEVVVTLGRVALEILNVLSGHEYGLKDCVGKVLSWNKLKLIPLYHPGPRAMVHRSFSKQTADFIKLSKYVHPIKGIIPKPTKPKASELQLESIGAKPFYQIIYVILLSLKEVSFFKLTKLLYLMDLYSLENYGNSLTSELYLREEDGPWLPNLRKAIDQLKENEANLIFRRRMPFVRLGYRPRFEIDLSKDLLEIVATILAKYGQMNNANLKIAAYRTKPMQYILEKEKQGVKMVNKPVIYKNKTIIDSENQN